MHKQEWNLFALATKFLKMFKTFVLACRHYAHKKNTIQMDRNGLEWPGITHEQIWTVDSSLFGSRFGTVGLGHQVVFIQLLFWVVLPFWWPIVGTTKDTIIHHIPLISMYGSGRLPVKQFNIIIFVVATWYTCWLGSFIKIQLSFLGCVAFLMAHCGQLHILRALYMWVFSFLSLPHL